MYDTNLISFILPLGISILVFLIFRNIVLWYWKVNTIVKNQERTNELLEELVKGNSQENVSKKSESIIPADYKPTDEIVLEVKATGVVETWKMKDWDDAVKAGNSDKFVLKTFVRK